jgi:regulator of replication initiation timing
MGFDGHVAIDYMLKLSDLQTEYEKLREKFNGVALIENNLAQGGKVDFRSFITSNETYKNLAKVYAEDIRLLGY